MTLEQWATKHGVGFVALADLRAMMILDEVRAIDDNGLSEAALSNRVRLAASSRGHRLWRNNVGAGKLATGSFVRFGLANDSHGLNNALKSSDLIGIHRLLITPSDVGTYVGQFYSVECKTPGWHYTGTPREAAQFKWLQMVTSLGGRAHFCTDEGQIL